MLDLSPYSTVLFVHVLSAVLLAGGTLSHPHTRAAIRDARSSQELADWLAFERRSSKWKPVLALVLLASGIYLGSAGWWTQSWFYVSVATWVANAVLAGVVLGRAEQALAGAIAQAPEGPVPPVADRLRRSTVWAAASGAMIANDVVLLYVMFNKPGLYGAIGLLAAANAVALALTLVRARQRSAGLAGAAGSARASA